VGSFQDAYGAGGRYLGISKLVFDYYIPICRFSLSIFISIAIMFLWVYYSAFVFLAPNRALLQETTARGKITETPK
jgi:hypothetical protein